MATAVIPPLTEEQTSSRRARELYKYFIPQASAFCTTQSSLPDTVLTAHAQLVAWRLNCQRGMVSLIDRETQYFVAESTKTLDLSDSTKYEDPSDAIWAGCVNVPKAGRLCEHTIEQLPTPDGDPPMFEVLDLTKDDRFNTLPFVVEAPFFKYYCGVPLRTKKGIAIGSLFALDNKIREPINRQNKMFLATMAENVMSHYENIKEKEDRKRSLHMNMCLAAFVDPEHSIRKRNRGTASTQRSSKPRSRKSAIIKASEAPDCIDTSKGKGLSPADGPSPRSSVSQVGSEIRSDESDMESRYSKRATEDDHIETFQRAADLLYDSLSLQTGGVIFMDTSTSYRSKHRQRKSSDESSEGNDSDRAQTFTRGGSVGAATLRSTSSWGPPRTANPPELSPLGSKPTEILAFAPVPQPASGKFGDPGFTPLAHDDIEKLIKRHPRGKLFNLDAEGILVSSSSGDDIAPAYNVPKSKKLTPSRSEAILLYKHFPGARQVIFLPLWDATTSKFSTFFAFTTSEFRTFSNNPDFLHCIAFCNCVMTEITRLATMAADQQKSDFIGSVSHELRSPLHGILASCEFLGDTETSSFQKSLIDTADSCARTLLDTINMVLDYSKINAFERNASKARRKRGQLEPGLQASGQPQLNIYGDVDLAAITEEVVEGVATGQVFKDSLTGVDAIDLTADVSKQSTPGKKDVEIILDISPRALPKDWVFVTQPGAFRRIIMNIFGNSLKYTRQGSIRVKLEAQSPSKHHNEGDPPPATLVRLTITDTGQGMSPQFMRTKLYTPFAQENSIAPGTGLGLSLVKSMVTMLNGEINIQSAVGVGTEVTVRFPMTLSSSAGSSSTSGSTPTSAGSIERIKDDSLQVVMQKTRGRRAVLFPDQPQKTISESNKMIRDAVNRYLGGWFGFEVTSSFAKSNVPDIIVTDEADVPNLLKVLPKALSGQDGPMIVVLCTAASRRSNAYIMAKSDRLEAVSYPFGPYKLAKTIRICLDKLEKAAIVESEAETHAMATAEESLPPDRQDFGVDEVATAIEQITITDPNLDVPDVIVIKSGDVVAHGDSIYAGLLGENQLTNSSGDSHESQEYPFPAEDGTISPSNINVSNTERPPLSSRRTISPTRPEIASRVPEPAAPMSSMGALATDPLKPADAITGSPRMLLVDDNSVNLRLLQTFMKKRKYTDIFSAEDGQQAVSVYRNLLTAQPPRPPDIIFMDISMPVMNGFEATRRIRDIEAEFRSQFPSPMQTPASALIIALTGLASGRDQSEAFTSGFDLYLVKPISFREVGRLLDNWEKSGGAATVGVPHGPAVAGSSGVVETLGGLEGEAFPNV